MKLRKSDSVTNYYSIPKCNELSIHEKALRKLKTHIHHRSKTGKLLIHNILKRQKLADIEKDKWAGQWFHKALIPALRRQRQVDLGVWGQPDLQSEFRDSHGYAKKLCLKKKDKWFPEIQKRERKIKQTDFEDLGSGELLCGTLKWMHVELIQIYIV